jgi:CheY-like chemotaxis protein
VAIKRFPPRARTKRRVGRAPVVAVINTNDDLVQGLARDLESDGYTVATAHIENIKSGSEDFIAFLKRHEPAAVIYDIAIPYDDNWTFLNLLRELPMCGRIPFVVTTVNKAALEARVGPTDTIEIRGGHADDVQPTLEALRRALKTTERDERSRLGKRLSEAKPRKHKSSRRR